MTYELEFNKTAYKEWKKLGSTVREQFKKKLAEVLQSPHIPRAKLSGSKNLYKIKLRQSGYRLVYEVQDEKVTITVVSVGKRDKSQVYKVAKRRTF